MFKKDDYIVVLIGNKISFLDNYLFKQRMDYDYLKAYLDTKSTVNGISNIECKRGLGRMWRYATQNEIDYYDLIGKPFDTTSDEFLNYKFKPDNLSCLIKILEGIKNE